MILYVPRITILSCVKLFTYVVTFECGDYIDGRVFQGSTGEG